MKNRFYQVLCIILGLLALCSCVTMKGEVGFPKPPFTIVKDEITATLSATSSAWVELEIANESDSVIILEIDLSSFTYPDGTNSKLAVEGTKYIDAKNTQPPISIPPKSQYRKNFFAVESIYYSSGKYGGWRSKPWVPVSLEGSSFVFAYRINGEEDFLVFAGSGMAGNETDAKEKILGSVSVKKTFWNFLFLKSKEKRRSSLLKEAQEVAEKQYGQNIKLINVSYSGSWSPLSLLLYFSMFGFVEDATITVDVISR